MTEPMGPQLNINTVKPSLEQLEHKLELQLKKVERYIGSSFRLLTPFPIAIRTYLRV